MPDISVCCTSLYARATLYIRSLYIRRCSMLGVAAHCMIDVAVRWMSQYTGHRYMLDVAVCWTSLCAGRCCMLGVCCLLDVTVCWSSVYGGRRFRREGCVGLL